MNVDQVVEQLLHDPGIAANIAAYRQLPAAAAEYTDFPHLSILGSSGPSRPVAYPGCTRTSAAQWKRCSAGKTSWW